VSCGNPVPNPTCCRILGEVLVKFWKFCCHVFYECPPCQLIKLLVKRERLMQKQLNKHAFSIKVGGKPNRHSLARREDKRNLIPQYSNLCSYRR
jgi:hypothetical protein